jgi:hypothetical protein
MRIRIVFWPSGSGSGFGLFPFILVVVVAIALIASWRNPSNKDYQAAQRHLDRTQCTQEVKRQDGGETAGTRCTITVKNREAGNRAYVAAITYRSSNDGELYVQESKLPGGAKTAPGETDRLEVEFPGPVEIRSVRLYLNVSRCEVECITHEEMLEAVKQAQRSKRTVKPWRCETDAHISTRTCTRQVTIHP